MIRGDPKLNSKDILRELASGNDMLKSMGRPSASNAKKFVPNISSNALLRALLIERPYVSNQIKGWANWNMKKDFCVNTTLNRRLMNAYNKGIVNWLLKS
jgi:hypothetical protein